MAYRLEDQTKEKMTAAHWALLRKFTEPAFAGAAETRWQESGGRKPAKLILAR